MFHVCDNDRLWRLFSPMTESLRMQSLRPVLGRVRSGMELDGMLRFIEKTDFKRMIQRWVFCSTRREESDLLGRGVIAGWLYYKPSIRRCITKREFDTLHSSPQHVRLLGSQRCSSMMFLFLDGMVRMTGIAVVISWTVRKKIDSNLLMDWELVQRSQIFTRMYWIIDQLVPAIVLQLFANSKLRSVFPRAAWRMTSPSFVATIEAVCGWSMGFCLGEVVAGNELNLKSFCFILT